MRGQGSDRACTKADYSTKTVAATGPQPVMAICSGGFLVKSDYVFTTYLYPVDDALTML